MKIQLKDGFEVELDDNVMNSWRLLSMLRKVDKGDSGVVVDAAEKLFGEEQLEKIVEHFEDNASDIIACIGEVMASVNELKNS